MRRVPGVACALALLALSGPAAGHSFSPSLLEVRALADGGASVLWKRSLGRGSQPDRTLSPTFGPDCRWQTRQAGRLGRARLVRGRVACGSDGAAPAWVAVEGLDRTRQTVLLRHTPARGEPTVTTLRGGTGRVALTGNQRTGAGHYLAAGIEHVLLGYDHLLFVLCLLLAFRRLRPLLIVVTSFTVGHSISLSLAALGLVTVPAPPIEALIAFSIVLLAVELLRDGERPALYGQWWATVLLFGLLHGLGFAGALADMGLPRDGLLASLLLFNVGIEVGQLLFIGAVLLAVSALRHTGLSRYASGARVAVAYGAGSIACFWVIARTAAMMA